jgi:hypothetical protein
MSNMINWKKDMLDTMWACFWMGVGKGDTEGDKVCLKDNVAMLIRMATQKNAGQRGAKDCINWDALEHVMLTICCCATSLALAGEFGPMPEEIEGD